MRVTFIEQSGAEKTIENAASGGSLMELARANGIEGITADCGGGCACATCHIYIDAEWEQRVGKPHEIENEMLDLVADVRQENSRLSCQILLVPELDGLRVTVAPA